MLSLSAILESTRRGIPAIRSRMSELERAAANRRAAPDLALALRRPAVALIAEVKRRSPSAGAINESLDPATLARGYVAGGAAAISVLTDQAFFGGSMADLATVIASVATPVLRKDFILDESQVLEARAAGAAAVLLIVRALDPAGLRRLLGFSVACGLTPLVETHDAHDLARALDAGASVIGVNARDLDDFSIDAPAAWRLLATIPGDRIAVAESGMATIADVAAAAEAGADAVLIGSALASAGDPIGCARELSGVSRRGR
jgi:indole-3-glycerol phosphate synthase